MYITFTLVLLIFQTNEERHNVEDKLQELSLQHKGLQDLMVTLKDGKGMTKLKKY